MHWGHKITALYLSFVIFILAMIFLATKQHFDLVTENYYQDEIAYQEIIDKKMESQKLSFPIAANILAQNKEVLFSFPKELKHPKGTIYFYRANDAQMDFSIPIQLDAAHTQKLNIAEVATGYWKIKFDFTDSATAYYYELNLNLP